MNIIKKLGVAILLCLTVSSCHNYNTMTPKQIRTKMEPNALWVGAKNGGHGSGFIANYKGFRAIVTNSHVCQLANNNDELFVKKNLETKLRTVKVLFRDRKHDVCITTVPKVFRSSGLKLGMQPHEGDPIYVLGFPYGNRKSFVFGEWTGEQTITIAYSYSKKECPGRYKTIQGIFGQYSACYIDIKAGEITASTFPGNSGSAVVDNRGFIVGVLFAGSSNSTVSNYISPVRNLRKLFKTVLGR